MNAGQLREFWRRAQMIWQDPNLALSPHRNVWRIIAEPLVNYNQMSRRQIRQRVEQLMSLVELETSLGRSYNHQLSGGQCQRVCIARALALEPKLLICDEPVSALDLPMQKKIMDLINSLRQRLGLTVVIITHDLGLARRYCDEVAVMRKGRIVEKGAFDTALIQSAHPYVKSLLRSVPRLPWLDHTQSAQ
jgi:peptide/nickel transport system ATP-binding protein